MKIEQGEIERIAAKELQYIVTSTSSSYAFKDDHPDHTRVMGQLFDSLRRSLGKKPPQNGSDLKAIIRETPHYKLSEILKSATSWKEFVELTKTFMPNTNPRHLLHLGGLSWKFTHTFDIPTVRRYDASSREAKGTQPKKEEVGDIILSNIEKSFQELSGRIHSLEEDNKVMKKSMAMLMSKIIGGDIKEANEVLTWLSKATE